MKEIEIVDTREDDLNLFYSRNREIVETIVYGKSLAKKVKGKPYAERLLEELERESCC